MGCQGLAVPAQVMHHVVRVESSFNPYAIGVVGGRLARQPKNLSEALSTVRMLESRGYNFSLGLAQVNRYNLQKYGLDSYERAFEPCSNLVAGSQILAECYRRSGADWGKSFSCYYSGNFSTGFRHGYVQKIYASMRQGRDVETRSEKSVIEVVSRQTRRTVPVSRYPLYGAGSAPAREVPAETKAIAAAAMPPEVPAAPSRVQQVNRRIVPATPNPRVERTEAYGSPQGSVSYAEPASAAPASAPSIPAGSAPSPAAPARGASDVAILQPAAGSLPPATAPAKASASAPRPRGGRDPALVGAQEPEQDGAFVF
jgi:type IV secretion system protein VirB1